MTGYHITNIEKGVYGDFSKIVEEFYELVSATEQGSLILATVELCDLYGALEGLAESIGVDINQIIKYSSQQTEKPIRLGTSLKIDKQLPEMEEILNRLKTALEQDSLIATMVELSNLYSTIGELAKSLKTDVEQVILFSDITKRAFREGHRK